MRKLAAICGLIGLFALGALASLMAQEQPPQQAPEERQTPSGQTAPAKPKRASTTPKFELSGGYAYRSYYAPSVTLGMNGWYASLDYNIYRWLGIAGEVVDASKNQGIISGIPFGTTRISTFLVGPQFYLLAHRKLTPFGHFLYGAGYYRNTVPPFAASPGSTTTSLVRAWQLGAGLDYYFSQRLGVRLVQFDVGSSNFFPNSSAFTNRSMKRVSVGIVFRFGKR